MLAGLFVRTIPFSNDYLLIYEHIDGSVIAEHPIHHGKGKLIQEREHTRDCSKGIQSYISSTSDLLKIRN